MNLVAYDKVGKSLDKNKSWIDNRRNVLISRELTYHTYYGFVKRYEPHLNKNVYFLVLCDDWASITPSFNTHIDDYGRIKINLDYLVNSEHISLTHGANVEVKHVEHKDDGDIFLLNL